MWIMLPMIQKRTWATSAWVRMQSWRCSCLGAMLSTFVFNLFFVNLPVEGEPIELLAYFHGTARAHLVGVAAGIVLCTGILAVLVAQAGPPETLLPPTLAYVLQQGAVLIGALSGIFVWKDFRDCEPRVRAMVWTFILLFSIGLVSIGFAARAA